MQPLGIKLIAVLHWLRAAMYIAGGLAILGIAHLSGRMISAVANETPLGRWTAGLGNVVGIGVLLFALVWLALGFGIWSTKNWARVVTLAMAGIWLLFGLVAVAHFLTPLRLLRIAVDAAIVVYLMLPGVKRAFGA
jgi:uncharacterized membrane protein (DUF2068 family)